MPDAPILHDESGLISLSAAVPWAAENFQVQQYGTRYYADKMPPCELIPDPHAKPAPGFSSLKPSKPFRKSVTIGERKYTVPLDWHRAIEWIIAEGFDIDSAPSLEPFYQSAHVQRDKDFARGHAIHRVAEAFAAGKPHSETNPDALPYIPHLLKWLEANVTDIHAIEAVVFGHLYGGTGDAWLGVRGIPAYVDWKSRGADSSHGIYEEEIAQGGAYTSARYCILPSDDRQRAVRAPLPAARYGMVLSIRPDGVEEFWYELDKAQESFQLMHDAYTRTSESGKAARAAKTADPTGTVATSKRMKKAKPLATPTAPTPPDEGREATDDEMAGIRNRYQTNDDAKTWIAPLYTDAKRAHCDFHPSGRTARRVRIMDGLLTLAEHGWADDQAVKAIVRHVTDSDAMQWPTVTAGAAIGTLTAVEAAAFTEACRMFVDTRYVLADRDGPALKEVA